MSLMHVLFFAACLAELRFRHSAFPGALSWMALTACFGAQALRYWAIGTLGDRWNSRVIVLPEAPPVTSGPYRWLRHPNYVAVVVEIACLPLVGGLWITALTFSVANALMLRVRIRTEEKALGSLYARAFAGVPRFMPRVRHGN
jgi:methyltransferase